MAIRGVGGIGENSPLIRERVLENLQGLGIIMDPEKNRAADPGTREIQSNESRVRILVISTNEELEIARQTMEVLRERDIPPGDSK